MFFGCVGGFFGVNVWDWMNMILHLGQSTIGPTFFCNFNLLLERLTYWSATLEVFILWNYFMKQNRSIYSQPTYFKYKQKQNNFLHLENIKSDPCQTDLEASQLYFWENPGFNLSLYDCWENALCFNPKIWCFVFFSSDNYYQKPRVIARLQKRLCLWCSLCVTVN